MNYEEVMKRVKEHREEETAHLQERIDDVIKLLAANRNSIRGIAVVLVTDDHNVLFADGDDTPSDGMMLLGSTCTSMQRALVSAMEDAVFKAKRKLRGKGEVRQDVYGADFAAMLAQMLGNSVDVEEPDPAAGLDEPASEVDRSSDEAQ